MRNLNIKEWMQNRDKNRRGSSTKGNNQGKAPTLRVGCPTCNLGLTNPDQVVYVIVGPASRKATCKNGHTFPVGGKCHPTDA